VLLHLGLTWFMFASSGPVALSHYEQWRHLLSLPAVLSLYVLGLGAIGLYLSQGIAASVTDWGSFRRPETSRWVEAGCTVLSAMMLLVAINVLSHFATGRAFWMSTAPTEGEAASANGTSP
jgi:hypothetical protein